MLVIFAICFRNLIPCFMKFEGLYQMFHVWRPLVYHHTYLSWISPQFAKMGLFLLIAAFLLKWESKLCKVEKYHCNARGNLDLKTDMRPCAFAAACTSHAREDLKSFCYPAPRAPHTYGFFRKLLIPQSPTFVICFAPLSNFCIAL